MDGHTLIDTHGLDHLQRDVDQLVTGGAYDPTHHSPQ